jgi:polyisoprenoid-binding protein YceI
MFGGYLLTMKLICLFSLPALLLVLNDAHAELLSLDRQQCKIEVAVSSTIDSFVGQLEKYQANIDCSPTSSVPAQASVTFDFKDLKTGNPSRDTEMLKWLDYPAKPSCNFILTNWKTSGTTNYAEGTLAIHGVKKAVEMPVVVTSTGTNWIITGTADFNYRDFDLPIIRKMLVLTVDPNLHVAFHLVGTLPAK